MHKSSCMISIIVPIYGVEKYIKKCIDSIIIQSFQDWELILVDDGSDDNCGKICDLYASKDDRIQVLHKENEGLLKARIDGTHLANGEFITFVDGDDYILENRLEEMWNILNEYKVDMVSTSFQQLFDDGHLLESDNCGFDGLYCEKRLNTAFADYVKMISKNETSFVQIWSKLIRKSCLLKAYEDLDYNISVNEDVITVLSLFKNIQSMYVDSKNLSYIYRIRPNSMSKKIYPDLIYRHELFVQNYMILPVSNEINLIRNDNINELMYRKMNYIIFQYANSYGQSSYNKALFLYNSFSESNIFKPYFFLLRNHKIISKIGIVFWLLTRKQIALCALLFSLYSLTSKNK